MSCLALKLQLCSVSERSRLAEFIIKNHLDASARNERELKLQTDDLPTVPYLLAFIAYLSQGFP